MADLNITITNSMNVLGTSPGNLWGSFDWGELWGNDEDVRTETRKALPLILTVENILSKEFVLTISNSLDLTSSMYSVKREIGIWDYMFTRPTSEGLEQVYNEFSPRSNQDSTWNDVADTSTDWSGI